eukprot:INCI14056.1.p1 GENE.INCI14056.1~~INCI14056.1.p1  ORF type:complete len:624 (+),score=104.52 INCI14056.1:585-2456(+)
MSCNPVPLKKYSIGIDLGTTYSCVGAWCDGKIEIIPNEQGYRTTPSCVSFTESERFVGESASSQAISNPANTVFDAKRLLGRKFHDPIVQSEMHTWPFKVKKGPEDRPKIAVTFKGQEKEYFPEEISAMVLSKLKTTAEAFLDGEVSGAVVTVPAHFNDAQRNATNDAGKIAGLNVMYLLNEPTAAAIAFGLGGSDFDNNMVNHFVQEFKRQQRGLDICSNPRSMRRLRYACERAKRTLSSFPIASIELDAFFNGIDFSASISRSQFEHLNAALFQTMLDPVKQVLRDAKLSKHRVQEIVLVGGSTRIPKVQEILKYFFDRKDVSREVNPDEAVAFGAACQAAILDGTFRNGADDVLIIDVVPLSLGIEQAGGIMTTMIHRNTAIPTMKEQVFTTTVPYQTRVMINVFEGERAMVKDNHPLGTFCLEGIPSMPQGQPQIIVTFRYDRNGILHVTAKDSSNGRESKVCIQCEAKRLTQAVIDQCVEEAQAFRVEDEAFLSAGAKSTLENYISSVRQAIVHPATSKRIGNADTAAIKQTIDEAVAWLDALVNATAADIIAKRLEIQQAVVSRMQKSMKAQDDSFLPIFAAFASTVPAVPVTTGETQRTISHCGGGARATAIEDID